MAVGGRLLSLEVGGINGVGMVLNGGGGRSVGCGSGGVENEDSEDSVPREMAKKLGRGFGREEAECFTKEMGKRQRSLRFVNCNWKNWSSFLKVLRRLGSIFTLVYAAVQKLKKDSWKELQFNLVDNSKLNVVYLLNKI
ncbi:hypothetical protein Tco_1282414 [Tanacetum coccineum]